MPRDRAPALVDQAPAVGACVPSDSDHPRISPSALVRGGKLAHFKSDRLLAVDPSTGTHAFVQDPGVEARAPLALALWCRGRSEEAYRGRAAALAARARWRRLDGVTRLQERPHPADTLPQGGSLRRPSEPEEAVRRMKTVTLDSDPVDPARNLGIWW